MPRLPRARVFIRDLVEPPQDLVGEFAIINKQLGTTRDQKKYFLKCLIGDKSGQIPARMWTIDEPTYTSLATDGFVFLEGQTQAYQGEDAAHHHADQAHRAQRRADARPAPLLQPPRR